MNAASDGEEREPMPSMVPRMPMAPGPSFAASSSSSASSSFPPEFQEPEPHVPALPAKRRGNFFNTVFERIKEPLLVACLMFFLSLPMFHTAASKVVPWAFAVGGELSYLGLIVKSLFAGGLFALA